MSGAGRALAACLVLLCCAAPVAAAPGGAAGAFARQARPDSAAAERPGSIARPSGGADSAFRPDDLVEVTAVDSTIRLDIRYATPRNFMGRPMYRQARAFLQRPAAEALMRANRRLRAAGFGIVVFDGYRPWSITKEFWDETPPSKHSFVADPKLGSKHNRGCAVDCSLIDLRSGREAVMPSPYDDFTVKASPRYRGGTRAERSRRDLLRRTMEREHFTVDPGEWWHFDFRDWRKYRILDVPFEQLR